MDYYEKLKKMFCHCRNLILTGAPGTGKTHTAVQLAEDCMKAAGIELTDENRKKYLCQVQFHPGYDYSDFITGIKPAVVDKKVTFSWEDGIFKKFADEAKKEREAALSENRQAKPYIFIIDEINRADLSRVFGEVFSLLEEEYRFPHKTTGIKLPCGGDDFMLPDNLYLIGTMNDIDRSVESMDFALRRRFSWYEVKAEDTSEVIIDAKEKDESGNEKFKITEENHRAKLKAVMAKLNRYIGSVGGQEPEKLTVDGSAQPVSLNLGNEYQLGGAYFLNFAKYQHLPDGWMKLWYNHLAVILNEYLRGHKMRSAILEELRKEYEKEKPWR